MTLIEELDGLASQRFHRYVALANRMLKNVEDSEDAVQDAFVLAYKNIDQFRGAAKLSSWVGSIIKNVCLMKLREAKRHQCFQLLEFEEGEVGALLVITVDHVARIDGERKRDRVYEAISMLPPSTRLPMALRMDGLQMNQIADRLGVSTGSIKAYIHRGSEKVKKALKVRVRLQA